MHKRFPVALFLLSLGFFTCRKAEFEPNDGGNAQAEVPHAADADEIVCEAQGAGTCVPSPCAPMCHKRTGIIAETGDLCTISSEGKPDQQDNCRERNVCLRPQPGGGLAFCFALCDSTAACKGGSCAARALSSSMQVKVCDPPPQNCSSTSDPCCDPIENKGCGSGRFCYLVAPHSGSQDSWTICDYSTGEVGRGDPCRTSRDCLPKLTCFFESASSTVGSCRLACNPTDPNGCGSGTGTEACTLYGAQWGVCP
jgi:hypothetical protein